MRGDEFVRRVMRQLTYAVKLTRDRKDGGFGTSIDALPVAVIFRVIRQDCRSVGGGTRCSAFS